MKIVVLGAGVVGVTSAWYLRRAGHEVTVVEKRDGPALETSFANGGQISVSHAVPWANPDAPREILHWLGRQDAPLRFRLSADARQWLWGLRFLLECTPRRTQENTRQILALALESQQALAQLRAELALAYDGRSAGILSLYTDRRAYDAALSRLDLLGPAVRREAKTPDECVRVEPTLAPARASLAGGIYAPGDESGDAHRFTVALARHCSEQGVHFLFGHAVHGLVVERAQVAGVSVAGPDGTQQRLTADAYVVAAGWWSTRLLRAAGVAVAVYPVKGHSITLPVGPAHEAPTVSITDEEHKLVFSRLGARLRVAGMAELGGYDASVEARRCEAILARTFEWFPRAGERNGVECWAGLRPATPGNVPLIGKTRYPNLYLNTGHGTLGWTLACGSALRLTRKLA